MILLVLGLRAGNGYKFVEGNINLGKGMVRVGRIKAVKNKVGFIRGFVYGCKSEVKDLKE